ncbi:hypothetical protein [Streptomyces sp. NPDC001508]|uniref:hypothetical protein n=1 Tax=Streptomyces sp. NPDC001508 TaxID=3154656 RepID=UPI00333089B5
MNRTLDEARTVVPSLPELPEVPATPSWPTLPTLPSLPGLPEAPATPSWPTLPSLPEAPATPSRPTLPALPGGTVTPLPVASLPGLSELPGLLPPRPVASDPVPGERGEPQASLESAPRTDGRTAAHGTSAVGLHGPYGTAAPAPGSSAARSGGHRAAAAAVGPSHPAPAGDPDGTVGKSALDGGTSRHADLYALTSQHRVPLWLVPGTAVRVAPPGTRDTHQDIPVFPG